MKDFSIIITTYNRKSELKFTLNSLQPFIKDGVSVIVCDDASTDGTSEFIRSEYPEIQLIVNSVNKGLIFSRNLLMSQVQTTYAVSLDDDANFLSLEPLEKILRHFEREPKCGVISFRVYWGKEKPDIIYSNEINCRVKSFLGGAHAWCMKTWREIPNYPDWYQFYGEENFGSMHLLKKQLEVHYLAGVLVHHRVDNTARKKNSDYYCRARRSLRADWYNFIIFYPKRNAMRTFLYSIKMQILKAIKNRDIIYLKNTGLAVLDILSNLRRLKNSRSRFSNADYQKWVKLPDAKIYWKPDSSLLQNNKLL
jgi:glycosyltransferase involved in cell wall biosynthesis